MFKMRKQHVLLSYNGISSVSACERITDTLIDGHNTNMNEVYLQRKYTLQVTVYCEDGQSSDNQKGRKNDREVAGMVNFGF